MPRHVRRPRQVLALAVLPRPGAVIGVSVMPAPSFTSVMGPEVHVQPTLHRQLRAMLLDSCADQALLVARHSALRRRHCLELLLHEALTAAEVPPPSWRSPLQIHVLAFRCGPALIPSQASSQLLTSVVELLRSLGKSTLSSVCAGLVRRTDSKHWPALFAACGSASSLLAMCLELGR